MGIVASKRVKTALTESADFDSACETAYSHCLSLAQHAFQGVLPYQLLTASTHLHQSLSCVQFPLIAKWVPSPPSRSQADSALRVVTRGHKKDSESSGSGLEEEEEDGLVLGPALFKEWAVVLFADAIVGNARKAVLSRVPIGIAGIAGVGTAIRPGKDLIGAAMGVYALGVVTSIYLSLSC